MGSNLEPYLLNDPGGGELAGSYATRQHPLHPEVLRGYLEPIVDQGQDRRGIV